MATYLPTLHRLELDHCTTSTLSLGALVPHEFIRGCLWQPLYCFHFIILLYGFMLRKYIYTRIEAHLRRASLLRRIINGASAKTLKVCARFSVGVISDRELFRFFWAFGDQGRNMHVCASVCVCVCVCLCVCRCTCVCACVYVC